MLSCGVLASAAIRSYEDGHNFISRLAYGFTAVKTQPVHIASGYWHQIFHLQLPNLMEHEPVLSTCDDAKNGSCLESCDDQCRKLTTLYGSLVQLTTAMRKSIRQLVRHIFYVIPDINVKSPYDLRTQGHDPDPSQGRGQGQGQGRCPRAPLEFVSDFERWAFGTAKLSDVAELKQALDLIRSDIQVTSQDAMRTREGLAAFARMSNERMSYFHQILQSEQASLTDLYQQVRQSQESTSLELNVLTIMMSRLADYMSVHDQVGSISLGVDTLVTGKLSPQIITPRQMHKLLFDASIELRKQGAALCYTTPKEVYAAAHFNVARAQYDLIVRLKLPYTRHSRLAAYSVQTHALPVYGNQSIVTILQNPPSIILADSSSGVIGELRQLPTSNVADISDVVWHRPNSSSCLYAILEDHPADVAKFCSYAIRREPIVPSVTKLTMGTYVINNYTELFSTCPLTDQPVLAQEDCLPCLVHLDCGCYLKSNGSVIIRENDCDTIDHERRQYCMVLTCRYYNRFMT